MPVDYSKWDALELSDDSDVEVHPNVDKRSFIRAKQAQIHQARDQRRLQIATLRYEAGVNDALIARIAALRAALAAHAAAADAAARPRGDPREIAFAAVMAGGGGGPEDDQPPPRPAGVHGAGETQPTYTKMMAELLTQVSKAVDEKGVAGDACYDAMVAEISEHLSKVTNLQEELHRKLAELEKEEGKKITSDGLKTGFSSSHVNKSQPTATAGGKKHELELLNPNYSAPKEGEPSKVTAADDVDEHTEASPAARQFSNLKIGNYSASMEMLGKHPEILSEKETDALLILAFDAQLENNEEYARQCVHQALLLQYCRALGRDGVALFFKRITTHGHQAQDVFYKDVQETYQRIRSRAIEINKERAAGGGQESGVEQIQLHAVEPGTVINIKIPAADSTDPDEQAARKVFEGFAPEMKKALETGSLDTVNKVLGEMDVQAAEELVEKFGEAGVLSLEQEIIDATTAEGQEQWKQLEEQGKAANTTTTRTEADEFPDPESRPSL